LGSDRWGILARNEEKAQFSMLLGQLAATLNRLDTEQAQGQVKRSDQPLFKLLEQLHPLPNLNQRLELIVMETQRALDIARTTVYWFEPEQRYFWQRCSSRSSEATIGHSRGNNRGDSPTGSRNSSKNGGRNSSKNSSNLTPGKPGNLSVADHINFYNVLASNNLVSVGTAQSSLSPDATVQLLETLKLRSVLAAPIVFQNQFLGFVAAEATNARIWTEDEKQFLQGTAQLVALVSPLAQIDQEIAQHQADHRLIAQVSQAIRSEQEWNQVLEGTLGQLAEHFGVERVLLLAHESEQDYFELVFQYQTGRRKPLTPYLPSLSDVDWRLLEQCEEGVGIEDLEQDVRFLAWRSDLLEAGVGALLVCRTTVHPPMTGAVMILRESTRTWSPQERTLIQTLAQHLGMVLHQWQLQRGMDQQQHLYQTLQWGLTTIQQTQDIERLERLVTQSIAQILKAPLAVLVTWQSGRAMGKFAALSVANSKFTLKTNTKVPVQSDVLIQQALCTDGLLHVAVEQLDPDTRQWLGASGIEQVLALALRTNPEDEPLGVMIVADQRDRFWPERILSLYGILVTQLAWFRRSLLLIETAQGQRQQLQQLNWYKQYRLSDIKRSLETAFNQLNAQSAANGPSAAPQSIHSQQALRQLGKILSSILQIMRQEQWQLKAYKATVPLAGLLKRALERVDPLVKQHQLWVQTHVDETQLQLSTDVIKLEGILHQVLVFACMRSPEQGRVDLWCRLLDDTTLDLSITDYGVIEPRLLQELQEGRPVDALAPSALDQLPGLALSLCQQVLGHMGGSLEFYQLEDGRVMSRLVLPFIASTS
jgi:transcriptional regulator with GAF, ATPase, and Fis domain